ncbi:MAG TPA: efflux RND transporter permease subunit [Gemmatimonadaceae bacterium]|nr:efflux RND transporter permease subunit [Gemmatimonadaceae bacterium]
MFLSDISIKRPVFATMMMVALVVFGVVAHERLAIDEYPDISYPVIVANTNFPGASPEVVEREVTRPIEKALNTIQGIKEINSTSREGSSSVRITFQLNVDVQAMQPEVQAKVSRIRRSLPRDIDDPVVQRFDPNERPIMSVSMRSDERPIRELTDLAEEVVGTRIESVPGVGGVNVVGGASRQIRVELDPNALRAYALSPAQVSTALASENQEVPAGRIQQGERERAVRVTGRITDPQAFADVTVAVRDGKAIAVRDVGKVVDGIADRRSASYFDDKPAVSLEVLKISGTNTVEVADAVRGVITELAASLPADIQLEVVRDDSARIRESLADVELTLIIGALLTIAIIYLFLNSWRSTVITGLTLPVSIISAFFAMWVMDFTLNTMTLLALSLAIGLLIDDAIVVRENIVRHLDMGKGHVRAAREGTDEIGLAVLATTLAVVAVFVPVAFMGGQIGKIFFQFGVTVAFAVSVSLFVSFTLDPMLSSVWHDPEAADARDPRARARVRNPIRRIALGFDALFERVAEQYPRLLGWCLGKRPLVIAGAIASVAIAGVILPRLGFTYMPDFDAGEINVNFRVAPGSRIEYGEERGHKLAERIRKIQEIEFTFLSLGGGGRGAPSNGQIFARLKPKHERTRTQAQIEDEIRTFLRSVPGITGSIGGARSIFGGGGPGGGGQPVRVNVQGPDPDRLKLVAGQVLDVLRQVQGLAEPTSSDEGEIPQLNVRVDRQQAWAAGLGIASIASTLQPLFAGQRATTFQDEQGFTHDVVVVYPDTLRASADDVASIPVASSSPDARTGQRAVVPLGQVANIEAGIGPQQIERRALERQVAINAGVLPGYAMGDVAAEAMVAIRAMGLPPGYRAVFGGEVQNLNETKGYVFEAIILAVIFIYLILASLFGSFLQPLAIMLALPLSLLGVALALWITGGNLNVMSMIGIIMLMGLVTKNGILLIDFVNQARESGKSRRDAILASARVRLRPIVMTTAAMVFGMLPLAMALGEGAEQRAPMARAVIGGLITSTILTLFVVPVVYTVLDDVVAWLTRRSTRPAAHTREVPAPAGD